MLATVAAMGRNRVIGSQGTLPWKLPGDMRHFRETTRSGVVLMGRTTFDSIGRPLPERENWVLTRQPDWTASGVRVFRQASAMLEAAHSLPRGWVIGGEQIYRLFLPHCQQQLLTLVEAEVPGDAFYPEFEASDWRVIRDQPGPPGEAFAYRFVTYERV